MIKSIVLEGIIFLYVVPSFYLFCKDMQQEKDKEEVRRFMKEHYGGKIMFDKKEMKLVSFNKMKKLMMQGETVFMVMMDCQLVEITADTDWQMLFFHNMRGGSYAVYRKKFTGIGTFTKDIHIGKWNFTVSHTKKGGDA